MSQIEREKRGNRMLLEGSVDQWANMLDVSAAGLRRNTYLSSSYVNAVISPLVILWLIRLLFAQLDHRPIIKTE